MNRPPWIITWLLAAALIYSSFSRAHGAGPPKHHAYGWIGDDGHKSAPPFSSHPSYKVMKVSASSDLTPLMPPIEDQGQLGSCTSFGIGRVLNYAHKKAGGSFFDPGHLFVYWNERAMEGTVNEDAGAQITDGITVVTKFGACSEKLWPYDIAKFKIKPPQKAYTDGLKFQAVHAYKVDNTDGVSIRKALSNGFPVVVGFMVYQDFENLNSSRYTLRMPKKGERPLGGHCTVLTGHDDKRKLYIDDNSWNTDWGNKGRALLPYAYIHNGHICDDCWVIDIAE